METDFFKMLNEYQNAHKNDSKIPKKQDEHFIKNKEKVAVTKEIEHTKSDKKLKTEKKVKIMSFDEQYKRLNPKSNEKVIVDYLLTLDGMKEKMNKPNVSIAGMMEYIKKQAQKKAVNNMAIIEDTEVYGWGRHYYDEHGNVAE